MFKLLKEVMQMAIRRKKVILLPILLTLILLGGLLFLAQGSVVAPFIYALF